LDFVPIASAIVKKFITQSTTITPWTWQEPKAPPGRQRRTNYGEYYIENCYNT